MFSLFFSFFPFFPPLPPFSIFSPLFTYIFPLSPFSYLFSLFSHLSLFSLLFPSFPLFLALFSSFFPLFPSFSSFSFFFPFLFCFLPWFFFSLFKIPDFFPHPLCPLLGSIYVYPLAEPSLKHLTWFNSQGFKRIKYSCVLDLETKKGEEVLISGGPELPKSQCTMGYIGDLVGGNFPMVLIVDNLI